VYQLHIIWCGTIIASGLWRVKARLRPNFDVFRLSYESRFNFLLYLVFYISPRKAHLCVLPRFWATTRQNPPRHLFCCPEVQRRDFLTPNLEYGFISRLWQFLQRFRFCSGSKCTPSYWLRVVPLTYYADAISTGKQPVISTFSRQSRRSQQPGNDT